MRMAEAEYDRAGSAIHTDDAFMAGALINAIPGIILQLLILPFLVKTFTGNRQ